MKYQKTKETIFLESQHQRSDLMVFYGTLTPMGILKKIIKNYNT